MESRGHNPRPFLTFSFPSTGSGGEPWVQTY